MYKEFIHYEQALELKELGFDEYCFAYYNKIGLHFLKLKNSDVLLESEHSKGNWATAPLYQQAFRWFRENGYLFFIDLNYYVKIAEVYMTYDEEGLEDGEERRIIYSKIFNTYEEAEIACLKKLIEIAKNKL